MSILALAVASLLACAQSQISAESRPSRPAPTHAEPLPGIHVFSTAPYGDVGLDGNSIAIVGDDGILVFDSNGTPDAAQAVLSEIRKISRAPVRYLVHSHWHWDHWYGAEVYAREFPGLTLIAHEKTRELMAGPAIEFNRPGLERDLPAHIAAVEKAVADRRTGLGAADQKDAAALERHLAMDRWFLQQKRAVHPTLPNLTFRDRLTIHLGGRSVEVRHEERAITPGDAYLWLPAEKALVTGDLLIHPVTFALFCYPSGWIATLRKLEALRPEVVIPGHGATLRGSEHLALTRELLERELAAAREAKAAGEGQEPCKKRLLGDPEFCELRKKITGGDASVEATFELYLVDWFLSRAFAELEAPLDDGIPTER